MKDYSKNTAAVVTNTTYRIMTFFRVFVFELKLKSKYDELEHARKLFLSHKALYV